VAGPSASAHRSLSCRRGFPARTESGGAAARGGEVLTPAAAAAIERAAAETALIADPHRAIDWLSTFPQVVLFALDEPG